MQDGRGRLRKIEGRVPFPFLLDIAAFCQPSAGAAAAAHGRRSVRYQLLGVVEHRGASLKCAPLAFGRGVILNAGSL